MMNSSDSLFSKAYQPHLQAGMVLAGSLVITLLATIVNGLGIVDINPEFFWQITAASMLFYAVFNSIFSISAKDTNKYWMYSIGSFVVMALCSAVIAYFLSGLSINEAGPYRWIFIVLTFTYLVFLSIVNFMKTIVNYAENEDWQAPKQRKKKR